jgi:hypothetical protein
MEGSLRCIRFIWHYFSADFIKDPITLEELLINLDLFSADFIEYPTTNEEALNCER